MDVDIQALAQVFAGNRTGCNPHDRLPGRGSTAAAMVTKTILLLVGVVGMAWPEAILDLLVVARALVLVLHQQADGGAGGPAFEHARQDAHLVRFASLAGELRGAGAAPFHISLQIRFREREAWRTPVHHAAKRRAMTFAEARHREDPTEGVTRHALNPLPAI